MPLLGPRTATLDDRRTKNKAYWRRQINFSTGGLMSAKSSWEDNRDDSMKKSGVGKALTATFEAQKHSGLDSQMSRDLTDKALKLMSDALDKAKTKLENAHRKNNIDMNILRIQEEFLLAFSEKFDELTADFPRSTRRRG